LSNKDIITTKLGRYSNKDKEDIKALLTKSDKLLLLDLIDNIMVRTNLRNKVKEEFIHNVKSFRRDFGV